MPYMSPARFLATGAKKYVKNVIQCLLYTVSQSYMLLPGV